MRLVFAGTPAAAVPTLRTLAATHEIAAVITRPDAPQGRKRVMTPSPVAAEAAVLGLPVIHATRLDDRVTTQIADLAPDLGVIVAYGGLVREPMLSLPPHGWINLHFSLLPRWRGAAPVQRALIAGDTDLGVSVFRLVEDLDAGDVFAAEVVPVPPDATAGEALAVLAGAGAVTTGAVVAALAARRAVAVAQTGEPSYAAKLTIEDGRLDWAQPLAQIYSRYRGVTPEPGAFTTIDGAALKILDAAPAYGVAPDPGVIVGEKQRILIGTASDALAITRVQPAGRAAMSAADWWRGQRDLPRAGS